MTSLGSIIKRKVGTMTGTEISTATTGDPRAENAGPICKACGCEFFYEYVPRPNDYSGFCENCFERPAPVSEPGTASALPFTSTKPENLARLEKSREWIRDYHRDKGE